MDTKRIEELCDEGIASDITPSVDVDDCGKQFISGTDFGPHAKRYRQIKSLLGEGWVSASERLPGVHSETDPNEVLAFEPEWGIRVDSYREDFESEPTIGGGARSVGFDWWETIYNDAPRPTHWMPLPSPPQREKEVCAVEGK